MGGDGSPLFLCNMKQRKLLETAVAEFLAKREDLFLIELIENDDNEIEVVIESDTVVSLDDCVALSQHIEAALSRDVEDFALTVGSAGISAPFKVVRQYRKSIGEEIEVTRTNGARQKALLQEVTEEGIKISYSIMKKEEVKKKKVKETVEEFLTFKDIKSAKPIIKF